MHGWTQNSSRDDGARSLKKRDFQCHWISLETDLSWNFLCSGQSYLCSVSSLAIPEINLLHNLPRGKIPIEKLTGGVITHFYVQDHFKQRGLGHSGTESLKEILTCAHRKDAREHLKPIEAHQPFKFGFLVVPEMLILINAQFSGVHAYMFAKSWKDPARNDLSKNIVQHVSNRARCQRRRFLYLIAVKRLSNWLVKNELTRVVHTHCTSLLVRYLWSQPAV